MAGIERGNSRSGTSVRNTRRSVPGSGFVPRIHARAWVQRHRRHAKGSALAGRTSRPAGDGGHVVDDREGEQLSDRDARPPAYLQVGRDRPADVVHALDGKPLGEVVGTPATAVPWLPDARLRMRSGRCLSAMAYW